MNYEEFKLQFNQMNEELFASFLEVKEQRIQNGTKLLRVLSDTHLTNQTDLNSLDEDFLKLCEKQRKVIEKFQNQIEKLKEELQIGLTVFDENFNIEKEEEKLVAQKKRTILPARQIYRKELHDIQARIDKLEKERDQVLKEKEDLLEEEQKNFKAKMQELDKRSFFEVKRVKENTSKEYRDLESRLLEENNRKEIKRIQKSIKEIRHTGTIEAKRIALSYVDEEKEAELVFFRFLKNHEKEVSILQDEFQIKMEDLLLEKKYCDHKYQMEEDKYDFGTQRALHHINQNAQKKRADLLCSYHDQIQEANQEKINKQIEHLEQQLEASKKIFNRRYEKDFVQNQTILSMTSQDVESLQGEVKKIQDYFLVFMDQYEQIILMICNEYLDQLKVQEEEARKCYELFNYQSQTYYDFQYQPFIDKFLKITEQIQSIQQSSFNQFISDLHKKVEMVKSQMNDMFQTILMFVKKSMANRLAYRQNIEQILQDVRDQGIQANESYLDHQKELVEQEHQEMNQQYQQEKSNDQSLITKIDEEFVTNEQSLDKSISEHQQKNDALKESMRLQSEEVKNQLKAHIKETENNQKMILKNGELEIVNKYNLAKGKIEEEYKNKIDLL